MKDYALLARRIGLVGITDVIVSFRGLITLPILTKTLGTSGYGILAQVLITISLLIHFIHLGLGASLVRFLPSKNKKEISQGIFTVLIVITLIGVIISFLLFFSSEIIANIFLKDESAIPVIKIAVILLVTRALRMVISNSFRILGQIKRYSIVKLLQTFFEIGLIAYFVLSGYGVFGAMLALIISELIFLIVILLLLVSYAGFAFPDFSILRQFLSFCLPLVPLGIFQVVVDSSDRYVIGFFMGASAVGKYSAAYTIGAIALMISPFIIYILSPTLASLYDNGKIDTVKTHLSYSLKYFLLLSIPSAFGLSILAKPLFPILATGEFSLIGVSVVPLVSSGLILFGIYMLFAEVIKLSNRTKIFVIVFFIASILNIGLNIIFVPYFGPVGAAITTLISYAVVMIITIYKSRQFLKFNIDLNFIVKSIACSIIMVLIIWFINPVGIIEVIISIIAGFIIYIFMLFILKGFSKKELKTIIEVFGFNKLLKILHFDQD